MQATHCDPHGSYWIEDADPLITPSLLVFSDLVERNLETMVRMAGNPARLRPHCKTHKMPRVIEMQLQRGIQKHKAATFAEAEMLARAGATDVLLAYNMVGPNIRRAVRFRQLFPQVAFAVTADHAGPLTELSSAVAGAGNQLAVLLDVDTGQHRTGVPVGEEAARLYRQIVELPGLEPGGLHVYDGHNKQASLRERTAAIEEQMVGVWQLRDQLEQSGCPVPRLVCGGTVSFPVYAQMQDPGVELSPGTCVFFDAGYGNAFADLAFTVAAVVLTRVVSCPTADRVTLDLGYKAVASDPPCESRVVFPDLPDARLVLQNEEHLVVETALAGELKPGSALVGIPRHICPTSALHKSALVIRRGKVVDQWEVAARDRQLSV